MCPSWIFSHCYISDSTFCLPDYMPIFSPPGQARLHHLPWEAHSCGHTTQHDQWCAVCNVSGGWEKGI